MFSVSPSGVSPASNRTVVVRPAFSTVTRAENPCSARSASPVRPFSRKRAGRSGRTASVNGERVAGPSSASSRSVVLSTSVVTVSESTGSSGTDSMPVSFGSKVRRRAYAL